MAVSGLADLAPALLLTVGLVLALGAVNVLARDVDRLLTVLLRATFYATPILYPLALALDRIPGWLSVIYWINPLVGIMELYRAPFYPDLFYGWGPVLASLALTGVLLLVGIRTFRRLEPQILKEL